MIFIFSRQKEHSPSVPMTKLKSINPPCHCNTLSWFSLPPTKVFVSLRDRMYYV